MIENSIIDRAIKYLNYLKKNKTIKKSEIVELKRTIEELDSLRYEIKKLKEENKNENG